MTELDIVKEALAAEYEIQEELGRGGMAIVYKAKDKQLGRDVAVKVLPFSLAFDAEFVERFQREARTAAQLEHPSIIPIYRVGKSGRVIFFTMKFLRGKSLSNVLRERGRLGPPEIRRLLLEAGGALGHAARHGIVHRDIKPDNIMFDEFGQCIVTDFGNGALRDPGLQRAVAAETPLGRIGEPEDVAGVVASLLSPETRWITGQRVEVTGGYRL